MKTRTSPRITPESPNYIHVEIDQGRHTFRVPSALSGARIFQALPKDLVAAATNLQGKDPSQMLTQLQSMGAPALQLAGHVLGICWHHSSLDLDTELGPKEDILAHGERVFEELYEAGYALDIVLKMALVVMTDWMRRQTAAADVLKRADFLAPKPVQTN